jgi:homoserine O-acetyltransferase
MVITVDQIGGGLSSRPTDSLGERFPRYTMPDVVAAEWRLSITSSSSSTFVRSPASMGSFRALGWAIRYPNSTARPVLVAPAARSDAHFRSIVMGIEAVMPTLM